MISTLKRIRAHRRAHHKRHKQPLLPDTTPQPSTPTSLTIPDIFLCPISLDLMTDPVILPSGVTYDRSSIDKWLLDDTHSSTCPVTKHPIPNSLEIIPNHALRRAIQDWCVEYGLDRVPTPRPPLSPNEVAPILHEFESLAKAGELDRCSAIFARMKELGAESERNRRCIIEKGAGRALASVFEAFASNNKVLFHQAQRGSNSYEDRNVIDFLEEALSALTETITVVMDDAEARRHLETDSSLRAIVWFMNNGRDGSITVKNAIFILSEIVSSSVTGENQSRSVANRLVEIEGSVDLLVKIVGGDRNKDELPWIKRDALKVLFSIASDEETRTSLRGIGVVCMLLDVLIGPKSSREVCEGALGMLDELFTWKEGRQEAYDASALAIPVLVKKMLRVSDVATALSVSAVWKLCREGVECDNDDESGYGRWCCKVEALHVGAFQKLLLLLQMGCGDETKERASELLKWLNSCRDHNGGGGYECIDSNDFKNLKRSFD